MPFAMFYSKSLKTEHEGDIKVYTKLLKGLSAFLSCCIKGADIYRLLREELDCVFIVSFQKQKEKAVKMKIFFLSFSAF